MYPGILVIILVFLLGGCGPVYKTTYYYNEPQSQRGRDCVIKCQKMRQRCEHWAEQAYQQCKTRRSVERVAQTVLTPVNSRSPFRDNHSSDFECSVEHSRKINVCLEDFNACFRLCGGVVDAIEECVSNCG